MNIIENYNDALKALYEHVGFDEDYIVYPIDDRTNMYWAVNDDNVKYAKTKEDFESDGDHYTDELYKQRFYKKHVYKGIDLTMVFCDTHTDGMKYFAIFDNTKEIKIPTINV